ncbi:hypothetical protein IscW_ISCW011824 [Ixodes scapularis]|uniref:Uncharacterized protein n=1 Tax=Ixodes scapularis TaxID=6945 RepID=B7Q4F9_IXOSC|nr:hypothetical protein IscW_ISCW011824 [Ixodes scapularis]|eukprot:XP_002411537.1 hypothetical protein IscW_ISCW011824 [Ixodes scapularis]
MKSLMLHRFYAYGLLCRIGGCFFIQNFNRHSLDKARIAWKSLYTLYSALCVLFSFGFFIWFDVAFIIREASTAYGLSGLFSETLSLTLHAVVSSRILINLSLMIAGSGKLLDFFRRAVIFEQTTGFEPAKCCAPLSRKPGWSLLRRTLVVVTLATSYVLLVNFYIVHYTGAISPEWALTSKVVGSIAAVFLFLYDSLCYVVLRCCSGVLLEYVSAQLRAFQDCSKPKDILPQMQASRQLETIRLNVCSIRELTQILNSIWKASLAGKCAGIILANCVVLYSMFHDGVFKRQIWVTLSYCAYSSLAFLELVFISQALIDETQELKNATKKVRTSDATDNYAQELQYLHQSIDPKGMCLSGGGFFRLSKSLLVTMAGSIITYTVILVQTSDELTSKMESVGAPPGS